MALDTPIHGRGVPNTPDQLTPGFQIATTLMLFLGLVVLLVVVTIRS